MHFAYIKATMVELLKAQAEGHTCTREWYDWVCVYGNKKTGQVQHEEGQTASKSTITLRNGKGFLLYSWLDKCSHPTLYIKKKKKTKELSFLFPATV
jgi:hypothetical protein